MANFGKKAKLDCQKSTVKVECVVSVYGSSIDADTGKKRYKVIVQRLQDNITEEQAEQGLADALPFITNRKQWSSDEEGNSKATYSHYDYVSEDMMEAIKSAARNCFKTKANVENTDGSVEAKSIDNYCVRLDIGFNLAKGEAFFYRIKSGITADSLEKDIKYNMRHMPTEGRILTEAILEGHRHITDIASRVYVDSLKLGKEAPRKGADTSKPDLIEAIESDAPDKNGAGNAGQDDTAGDESGKSEEKA